MRVWLQLGGGLSRDCAGDRGVYRKTAPPVDCLIVKPWGSIVARPCRWEWAATRTTLGDDMRVRPAALLPALGLLAALVHAAAHAGTAPLAPDIPAKFEAPTAQNDYEKRDVMI